MTKYFVNQQGGYVGAFDGLEPEDETLVEVESAPDDSRQKFDFTSNSWLPYPHHSIADLRESCLMSISESCDAEINAIKSGYPENEILSWDKQESEARAFMADANAATPLLDAMSAAREITKAELAACIIAKADAFAAYTGALIGKRQKLEDQMAALFANEQNPPTAEDVLAIQWTPAE